MTGIRNAKRLRRENDFPHSDYTWPWPRNVFMGSTQHLTAQGKDWIWILRDNSADLYQLAP